jgi:hypothetical protein
VSQGLSFFMAPALVDTVLPCWPVALLAYLHEMASRNRCGRSFEADREFLGPIPGAWLGTFMSVSLLVLSLGRPAMLTASLCVITRLGVIDICIDGKITVRYSTVRYCGFGLYSFCFGIQYRRWPGQQ